MDGKIKYAKELRQQGMRLREIADVIGVSVATASLYCKGVMPLGKNAADPRKAEIFPLLKALYLSGKPVPEIAAITGLPASTLYDWRRELGLRRNSREIYVNEELRQRIARKREKDSSGKLKQRAVELYNDQNLATPEIAEILGVTATTVGAWLEKAGVARRKSPTLQTRKKLREANLGPKRYNWKGGVTPERIRTRASLMMRIAREICFARDDFTCRICRKRGGELNAHHIWPFQRFRDRIFDPTNLLTLCKACHDAYHNAAGGAVRIAIGPVFRTESA